MDGSGLVADRVLGAAPVHGISETGLYIVQFSQPSLASYTGGIDSLRATSPQATGEHRLNPNSPASRAYAQYLTENQNRFTAELNQHLARSVDVAYYYVGALNAVAVAVSHEEARRIASMPGVAAVYGDTLREIETDVGPLLIGAPAVWEGDTGAGVATRGEGVVIGVLDTGINSLHPSFSATDGDGYVHTNPNGAGVYTGWCVANPSFCNSKLIGAHTFHPNGGSPEDTNGHGSHTAGTAGGNAHIANFNVGNETYNLPLQGVAPRANIVAYKVCDPGCPGTASVASVNSAIMTDNVDVLNYSISGGDSPWNDAVDLAFLDASNAGIYVAASAGNAGPGFSTVAKTGPWNAATAASTHNRAIGQTVDVTSQGEPIPLQGLFVVPGEGTSILSDINSGIRYDSTNNLGCTAFAAGTFTGNLALIQRGGCNFATKATNAQNAGATGVVLFQSVGGPPITAGGNPAPPIVMMDLASGIALRDHVLANPTETTVRINASTSLVYVDEWEDIVAGFSSRGPSQYEILKPDHIAPGVNILAAVESAGGDAIQYGFLQGTSMSSPHGAGAAALMVALHPSWSPAEVRSALATTAVNGLFKEDGLTPADPFDVGSGRLDLSLASTVGLVFNETGVNYAAANPAIGGDPKTLNQPSVVNYDCAGTCTWTREVRSTLPIEATYTASFSGPAGMNVTVTPGMFTIPAGGTQVLTIEADVASLAAGAFAFGSVTLSTASGWPNGSPALQGTAVYSGNTTGAPPWQRPFTVGDGSSGSCSLSGTGSAVAYLVQGFTVDTTGAYDMVSDQDYDGFLHLYQNAFDPLDQCLNLLALNDDGGPGSQILGFNLNAGTTYYLVTSGFANTNVGNFTNTISGPGDITLIGMEAQPVAATNIPVVVVPALAFPVITVDPSDMTASQVPDTQTTQTLIIGNTGGVNLEWEISQDPVAMRLALTVDGAGEQNPQGTGTGTPISFILDDGTGENSIGVGGAQFIWLNRFTPNSFNFPITIDSVDVMFGYPGSTGGINVGELVDIYLYEDADGNPANGATHRASLNSQAVQAVDGVIWSSYTLNSPVTFDGPGDILIAVVNRTAGVTAGTFPAVIDQSSPSQLRSWAGFGAVPGDPPVLPLPTFGIIDSFGASFAGNWLVRGFGQGTVPCAAPSDVSWLSVSPDIGTTTPGGSSNVTVTFDSTGLSTGEYEAYLCIESNDPENPLIELPVTMRVAPDEMFTDRFEEL